MYPGPSRRAGLSLISLIKTPACLQVERSAYCRADLWQRRRPITSSSSRLQQPAPSTQTAPPQAVGNNAQAPHQPPTVLSESDRLRNLETTDAASPRSLTDQLSEPPPFLNEGERQVDWTRSYHGLSSSPFTAEQAAILQQPIAFDDIEVKPDGIIYLPEIKYRRILNRAFGPGGWGLAPRGETIVTAKLVTREYGLVCGGRYAYKTLRQHQAQSL